MTETKLVKWGNSQGVVIPKRLCEHLGIRIGDPIRIEVDSASGSINLACPRAEAIH